LRELNTLKQVRIPVRIYILMIVKWGSEDNIWFIIIVCGMGVSFIEISKIRN
jgi:lipopolysaccharide/colanic/teichoic acid biosynthesis glycosyltransferase